MPSIGDIKAGTEIGFKSTYLFIYAACLDCKQARWIQLHKEKPVSQRCPKCHRATMKKMWFSLKAAKG